MGKKPLVGVIGALWLGLSLSGCESCNCGNKFKGQSGNIRSLANGGAQQKAWTEQPQGVAAQPTATGTTMPASRTMAPTTDSTDGTKGNYTVPATNVTPAVMPTTGGVSSTGWQNKPTTGDPAMQPATTTMPAASNDSVRQSSHLAPYGETDMQENAAVKTAGFTSKTTVAGERGAGVILPPMPTVPKSMPPIEAKSGTEGPIDPPPPAKMPAADATLIPPPVGIGATPSTPDSAPGLPSVPVPVPPSK